MVVTLSFRSVTHLTDNVHCHLLWAVGVTLASSGQLSPRLMCQRDVKSLEQDPETLTSSPNIYF